MGGLDLESFNRKSFKFDEWNDNVIPALRLTDLDYRDESLPIRLSIMMSINDYRRSQLARSLECLCRQNWKEFEVLICDNGSKQDLETMFEIFRPYLRLKTVRLERAVFSASPALGFKTLIPMAEGEILAIMQPEMMLVENAAEFLYRGHECRWPEYRYTISTDPEPIKENRQTWVTLKPGFFDDECQKNIDKFEWHDDIRQIENWPLFWKHSEGLSGQDNYYTYQKLEWPWWFVGSARASANIWAEMPIDIRGHATIDLWLLNYRNVLGYIDICPRAFMGYHQFHLRTNFGLDGEINNYEVEEILRTGVRERETEPMPLADSVSQEQIGNLWYAPPSPIMDMGAPHDKPPPDVKEENMSARQRLIHRAEKQRRSRDLEERLRLRAMKDAKKKEDKGDGQRPKHWTSYQGRSRKR